VNLLAAGELRDRGGLAESAWRRGRPAPRLHPQAGGSAPRSVSPRC